MSFLTEYFDNYRVHPYKKTQPCSSGNRYCPMGGEWLKPTVGGDEAEQAAWTDADIQRFIRQTMASLRGESVYFSDYCAHHPDMPRPFKPRPRKPKPCPGELDASATETPEEEDLKPIHIKDTELMATATALYTKDPDHLVLQPLDTHHSILGYARQRFYGCNISEYTDKFGRVAYVLIRDSLVKAPVKENGNKKAFVPDEMIPVLPYNGESLF